jgi:hypothetical protein
MSKSLLVLASVATAAFVAACSSTVGGHSSPPAPSSVRVSGSNSSSQPVGSAADNSTIPPADLPRQVGAAMKAASRFRLAGTGTDDGKPLQFDIHFAPGRAAGWITQGGQKIEVINLGGAYLYLRMPDALWRQVAGTDGDTAVALFSGKWVKVPANNADVSPLASEFRKDSFVSEMTKEPWGNSGLRKVGPATVESMAAIEYRGVGGSLVYIAAHGTPVLLKIVDSGSDGGTVTLSEYGKAYPFAPPSASETVDFAWLGN